MKTDNGYMLTHGTNILFYGSKEDLSKRLEENKSKIEKNGFEIQEYVAGSKIIYRDNEKREFYMWEIRKC